MESKPGSFAWIELATTDTAGAKSFYTNLFGWKADDVPDTQDRSTFERSKLDWKERKRGAHAEVLEWYRDLIRLRRATPTSATAGSIS